MDKLSLDMLPRLAAEVSRKWPGSRIEAVKVGRRKTTLLLRINGVRVKAIIYPAGRIRVFSPLTGVNIALTRMLERWITGAAEPLQEEA